MNISPITPSFTGSSTIISISTENKYNKQKPFLYNEILEILEDNYFPHTIKNSLFNINIEDVNFQAEKMKLLKAELAKRGIKFMKIA
jgi:hypothetical protein